MNASTSDLLAFWRAAGAEAWFGADPAFDARCAAFEAAHHRAARGELSDWAETAEGALALVLLLDQMPRNLYRRSPHAYATDGLARRQAEAALAAGFDEATPPDLRLFFYLPFEHSEDLRDQERAVALIAALGDEKTLAYAHLHRTIIARFARFPHRNAALGRESTPEELAFLAQGGFAG